MRLTHGLPEHVGWLVSRVVAAIRPFWVLLSTTSRSSFSKKTWQTCLSCPCLFVFSWCISSGPTLRFCFWCALLSGFVVFVEVIHGHHARESHSALGKLNWGDWGCSMNLLHTALQTKPRRWLMKWTGSEWGKLARFWMLLSYKQQLIIEYFSIAWKLERAQENAVAIDAPELGRQLHFY